jgi:PAS domain S-box-containing protein
MAKLGREIRNKITDSFFVLDKNFTLISMKPETCEMLGYEGGELVDQPLKTLVTEKCYPRLRWSFLQARHRPSLSRRVFFRKKNGHTLRVDYLLFNAVKENREIFVAVTERVNRLSGVIRHCTGRARRCKDISALYDIGKLSHMAATPEEFLFGVANNLAWAVDHPQLTATRVSFDDKEYLVSQRRPDPGGHRIVANLVVEGKKRGEIEITRRKSARPFLTEKQELLTEVCGNVSDFIYRKEIEQRLEDNSIRLLTLFDAITDLLFMIGADFTIKMVNKDMDMVGQKCHQAFYGLAHHCPECPAVIVLKTRQPANAEKRDGQRIFNVTAYPIMNADREITDLVMRSREITQEKNLEQQLLQAAKLASLGELVSGIAHEINNPNTFIRGNTSIIAEAFETILPLLDRHAASQPGLKIARLPYPYFRDKITTLVSDMQKGSDRISRIISDLRQFARPDENADDEEGVVVNEVVSISLRLVHNQVKRSADLHLDLAPGLPPITGNSQKLEQVLVNIIINASHAIEDKKKKGNIRIRTFRDGTDNIHIHIQDDGVGMTQEIKDKLFNPFFTTRRNRQGTGLGLSIAYGIVRSFQGQILVDSQPGEGSEFAIVLPIRAEKPVAEKKGPELLPAD